MSSPFEAKEYHIRDGELDDQAEQFFENVHALYEYRVHPQILYNFCVQQTSPSLHPILKQTRPNSYLFSFQYLKYARALRNLLIKLSPITDQKMAEWISPGIDKFNLWSLLYDKLFSYGRLRTVDYSDEFPFMNPNRFIFEYLYLLKLVLKNPFIIQAKRIEKYSEKSKNAKQDRQMPSTLLFVKKSVITMLALASEKISGEQDRFLVGISCFYLLTKFQIDPQNDEEKTFFVDYLFKTLQSINIDSSLSERTLLGHNVYQAYMDFVGRPNLSVALQSKIFLYDTLQWRGSIFNLDTGSSDWLYFMAVIVYQEHSKYDSKMKMRNLVKVHVLDRNLFHLYNLRDMLFSLIQCKECENDNYLNPEYHFKTLGISLDDVDMKRKLRETLAKAFRFAAATDLFVCEVVFLVTIAIREFSNIWLPIDFFTGGLFMVMGRLIHSNTHCHLHFNIMKTANDLLKSDPCFILYLDTNSWLTAIHNNLLSRIDGQLQRESISLLVAIFQISSLNVKFFANFDSLNFLYAILDYPPYLEFYSGILRILNSLLNAFPAANLFTKNAWFMLLKYLQVEYATIPEISNTATILLAKIFPLGKEIENMEMYILRFLPLDCQKVQILMSFDIDGAQECLRRLILHNIKTEATTDRKLIFPEETPSFLSENLNFLNFIKLNVKVDLPWYSHGQPENYPFVGHSGRLKKVMPFEGATANAKGLGLYVESSQDTYNPLIARSQLFESESARSLNSLNTEETYFDECDLGITFRALENPASMAQCFGERQYSPRPACPSWFFRKSSAETLCNDSECESPIVTNSNNVKTVRFSDKELQPGDNINVYVSQNSGSRHKINRHQSTNDESPVPDASLFETDREKPDPTDSSSSSPASVTSTKTSKPTTVIFSDPTTPVVELYSILSSKTTTSGSISKTASLERLKTPRPTTDFNFNYLRPTTSFKLNLSHSHSPISTIHSFSHASPTVYVLLGLAIFVATCILITVSLMLMKKNKPVTLI